jgi:hypothetical protein
MLSRLDFKLHRNSPCHLELDHPLMTVPFPISGRSEIKGEVLSRRSIVDHDKGPSSCDRCSFNGVEHGDMRFSSVKRLVIIHSFPLLAHDTLPPIVPAYIVFRNST